MLRTSFGRVRGRLMSAPRMDVFASTSGNIRSLAPTNNHESYVSLSITDSSRRTYPLLMRIHCAARIQVATRPLVPLGTASPHDTDVSLLARRFIQKRFMSTDQKKNKSSTSSDDTKPSPPASAEQQEHGRLSSIVRSVGPTLRKVTEWNVGDLLSVYAIVLLIALIIFSPYMVE